VALIRGTNFNDRLFGTVFNDNIQGFNGNDILFGNSGNDFINGGFGNDFMNGGFGNDTYIVNSVGDRVVETIGGVTGGIDRVVSFINYGLPRNIENLSLNGFAVLGNGNAGANVIRGTNRSNVLNGFSGNDFLSGAGGNDVLTGGFGRDVLTGGFGRDTFRYFSAAESRTGAFRDVITDFTRGFDKINLLAIDANPFFFGNQRFSFIGGRPFTGFTGQVRYGTVGFNSVVEVDINGDRFPEMQIQVNGTRFLTATDFIG